jgi:FAD/FMN-containing dehydrogenase
LYSKLNYQFNTRIPEILPLAYVVPNSAEDVQIAVKCGKSLSIEMIAKSGGHSYEKFSFGNSNSVIVDLRNLSSISIDPVTKTADVGTGNLIGHVYWAAWSQGGFGLAGPDCVSIGVGGLSLGGGHGYWGKRYGITLDSLIELDMVDSNGELLLVNEETNSELFWAMRGAGGGNFGIVTRLKYRLFDARDLNVTHITLNYGFNQYAEAFKAYQSWIYKSRHGSTYTRFRVTGPSTIDINIVDADLSGEDVTEILSNFPEPIGNPISISSMNFIELYAKTAVPPLLTPSQLGLVTREALRYSYRAKSYYSNFPLNERDISALQPLLTSIPSSLWIDFSSMGGKINQVAPNATSYVHRNSLSVIQIGIYVENQESADWVNRVNSALRLILDNGESYQNYIDEELSEGENYLRRYYGNNLEKLIKVERRVDPDNYFSYRMGIPQSTQ